jgi:hypothetical protein
MNQKKRTSARWEESANKAAKVFGIPAAELKREIKRALTRFVAERIAQREIAERQKSSTTAELAAVSHIVEAHYQKD